MKKELTENELQSIKFRQGTDSTTNCEDDIYDVIVVRRVIHHFEKADQMMVSIKKSMNEDTIIYAQEIFLDEGNEGCKFRMINTL